MRKFSNLVIAALAVFILHSCQKDKSLSAPVVEDAIPAYVQMQIKAHGFSAGKVQKAEKGYIVEGDILLTPEFLNSNPGGNLLQTAEAEQYRTTYLVTGLPRVIKVKVNNLGANYITGTDEAIRRFNELGLKLSFQRISSGSADINIQGYSQGPVNGFIAYGTSGFPNSSGKPYSTISINTHRFALGTAPNPMVAGSIIQHEIGHCIGFRHTDYMNRSYSCGGAIVNEGAGNSGAVFIPGTPPGPDANSWMLACTALVSRSFNENDVIAINYLYK